MNKKEKAMSKEETFYFDETLIDILWEVKEGKKHPNRAFKEINKYADQELKKAVLKALERDKKFYCDNVTISRLRNTKTNAEWRRLVMNRFFAKQK
jgi:hypothetical protein